MASNVPVAVSLLALVVLGRVLGLCSREVSVIAFTEYNRSFENVCTYWPF